MARRTTCTAAERLAACLVQQGRVLSPTGHNPASAPVPLARPGTPSCEPRPWRRSRRCSSLGLGRPVCFPRVCAEGPSGGAGVEHESAGTAQRQRADGVVPRAPQSPGGPPDRVRRPGGCPGELGAVCGCRPQHEAGTFGPQTPDTPRTRPRRKASPTRCRTWTYFPHCGILHTCPSPLTQCLPLSTEWGAVQALGMSLPGQRTRQPQALRVIGRDRPLGYLCGGAC